MTDRDEFFDGLWLSVKFALLGTIVASLVLAATGCYSPHSIPAKPVEGVIRRVVERHDTAVKSSEDLSDTQKEQALLDSEILLKNLDAALED